LLTTRWIVEPPGSAVPRVGAVEITRPRASLRGRGYPTTKEALLGELHVGTVGMLAAAGFAEAGRPTIRRVVMRIDF
jgi:hypothetical protein